MKVNFNITTAILIGVIALFAWLWLSKSPEVIQDTTKEKELLEQLKQRDSLLAASTFKIDSVKSLLAIEITNRTKLAKDYKNLKVKYDARIKIIDGQFIKDDIELFKRDFLAESEEETDYPIAQISEGDTNIVIIPAQLKFANRKSATVVFLTSKVSNIETKVESLEKSLLHESEINKENVATIELYKLNSQTYTDLIVEKDKTIEYNLKVAKKEKRKAIVTTGIVGVVSGLILSIFI